jgi:predicted deacylase
MHSGNRAMTKLTDKIPGLAVVALMLAALLCAPMASANEAVDEQDEADLPSADLTAEDASRSQLASETDDTGMSAKVGGDMEDHPVSLADAVTVAEAMQDKPGSIRLLKALIPPGTYQRLSWSATELFEGVPVSTPVLVVNGRSPGPTLCLTAAVHGDELNGIEVVRRVLHNLDPAKLSGTVIGVPIVNLQGFRRGSRYLPDRRDLNRYFPGNPGGSAASRIAYSFFNEVVVHCDALVDLHTGSFERANLPQLRADLTHPNIRTLTMGFGATVILHSSPARGTLRDAATNAGIAAVTLEAGGPSVLELKEVKHGVKGIETLLNTLGMLKKLSLWGDPEPIYYRSTWVRADRGGILLSDVSLGATIEKGELLGTITDPMNNASSAMIAPYSGRIIGMARNQVVMPGFAAFHIGIETDEAIVEQSMEDVLSHERKTQIDDYIDGMSE